ncbi:MAG: hypothetical protein H0U13_05900 [Gemmatimonadaceae bacterium]|nr:hypothetical protein [Gemmatimonadaceae bacterium]
MNRSFDKVYVSFSALALLLWSVAMIRERILSRSLAVFGIISGILMLALTLSGRLKFNIHGFGAVVLAQGIWFLWMSATLRQAEQPVRP